MFIEQPLSKPVFRLIIRHSSDGSKVPLGSNMFRDTLKHTFRFRIYMCSLVIIPSRQPDSPISSFTIPKVNPVCISIQVVFILLKRGKALLPYFHTQYSITITTNPKDGMVYFSRISCTGELPPSFPWLWVLEEIPPGHLSSVNSGQLLSNIRHEDFRPPFSRSCYPLWILKCAGLESSGRIP